jgi:hypothetical protein
MVRPSTSRSYGGWLAPLTGSADLDVPHCLRDRPAPLQIWGRSPLPSFRPIMEKTVDIHDAISTARHVHWMDSPARYPASVPRVGSKSL